jgi:hypothetical protein
LTKSWALGEWAKLKFGAEVFNLTNSNRFDVSPAGLYQNLASPSLGTYQQTLSTFRRMQFSLRVDF